MARCVDRPHLVRPKTEYIAVRDPPIGWDGHHALVLLVARESRLRFLTHRPQRLDVVTMAVRGQDMADSETLELLEDARRIVGGDDREAFVGLRSTEQLDVVVGG